MYTITSFIQEFDYLDFLINWFSTKGIIHAYLQQYILTKKLYFADFIILDA